MLDATARATRGIIRLGGDLLAAAPPKDPTDGTPVVLVHGILGQELVYWNVLKRLLRRRGIPTHEISLPLFALGDLREAAVHFRKRLITLQNELDVRRIDVIAHSAGGLVTRYFLQRLQTRDPVRRLITMGTPHLGTRSADLLPQVGMVGQVRPDSAFMKELNEDDPTPGPTRYTAIWTPLDGVVLPGANARLPTAPNVENVRMRGVTHWGFLVRPRVADFLAQTLATGFVGGDREWPLD